MANNQQKSKSVPTNVEEANETANSVKGEIQIANDAKFWLKQVKPVHFTWLNDEAKQKVKLLQLAIVYELVSISTILLHFQKIIDILYISIMKFRGGF